jgi:hypothetical protein
MDCDQRQAQDYNSGNGHLQDKEGRDHIFVTPHPLVNHTLFRYYNSGNGHLQDKDALVRVSLQPCQILHTRGKINQSLNIL